MIFWIVMALTLLLGGGCTGHGGGKRPDFKAGEVAAVPIHDYGRALFSIPSGRFMEGLAGLSGEYGFFLRGNLADTLAVLRMREFVTDPFIRTVAKECMARYDDLQGLEDSLGLMFAYLRHYFPSEPDPKVYAYVSGLHYEQPVEYFDSVMIIGLDMFLGEASPFYAQVGMPAFMAHRCTRAHILPSCAEAISHTYNSPMQQQDLVSAMLFEGKRLYFMQSLIPGTPDHLLLKYTSAQLEWCRNNEESLWGFLIDNELIYSTDLNAFRRLMQDGPFTAAFGTESAPRPGHWLGWMMVQKYMERHPETSLAELMQMSDAHALFQASGYRPR